MGFENVPDREEGPKHTLKEKLKHNEKVYGLFWKASPSSFVEILGGLGFDFFIIDFEHGSHSFIDIEGLVLSANKSGVTPIVRVPNTMKGIIPKLLDSGVEGILVPCINSKVDAQEIVSISNFFPIGKRGMETYSRSGNYGLIPVKKYLSEANKKTIVAVQIEDITGAENLKEILEVEGLDVIFIGPYDLSQSMGIPGQVDHPKLISKIEEMVKLILQKKTTAAGIYIDNPKNVKRWADLGVQFLAVSVDIAAFYQGCKLLIREIRR
jgi:4-hydroxy-2-oxoheptanedioate aldolase